MFNDNWFNSNFSIGSAWSACSAFTASNFLEQITGDINPITLIGWIITTIWGILASYSRWKLNNAEAQRELSEARKNNAEALKIELTINKDETLDDSCEKDNCNYKDFYEKIYPLMKHHFSHTENKD